MPIKMVDISEKPVSFREAKAQGAIRLKRETLSLIKEGKVPKGDPLTAAQLVGINAAKRLWELLPLCHQIPLSNISVDFSIENDRIIATSTVRGEAKTGVEMEALAAVLLALLNIWDMVKAYEKDEAGQYPHTQITDVRVLSKVKREA